MQMRAVLAAARLHDVTPRVAGGFVSWRVSTVSPKTRREIDPATVRREPDPPSPEVLQTFAEGGKLHHRKRKPAFAAMESTLLSVGPVAGVSLLSGVGASAAT